MSVTFKLYFPKLHSSCRACVQPSDPTTTATSRQYGKRSLKLPYSLIFCYLSSDECFIYLSVHGSLARAGKVKAATPKVDKQEKKKTPKGRAKKRILYNRRYVFISASLWDVTMIGTDSSFSSLNKFRECHNTTWWKEKDVSH